MAVHRFPGDSMLLELGVPQGRIVSRRKGGEGAAEELLSSAKKGALTGYLKVWRKAERSRSEGAISFHGGVPAASMYVVRPAGKEEQWSFGESASDLVIADCARPDAEASLHDQADLAGIVQLFPRSRLDGASPKGEEGLSPDVYGRLLGHQSSLSEGEEKASSLELRERRSYLVEEARPELSYRLLNGQLDAGRSALIFSRSNPAEVRERLRGRGAEIYWLTELEEAEGAMAPSLEKMAQLVEAFLHKEGRNIVLLDGISFLLDSNTFDGVVRFIRTVVDQVTERSAIFMLSIPPQALSGQQRSVLERELEPLRP